MWHDDSYLKAAAEIHRFMTTFLKSPDGAFYVSQDADLVPGQHSGEYYALDDAGRRKLGVPRVDMHTYARENGSAIQSLATLYAATGDEAALKEAQIAAGWVMDHCAIEGGGFRHGADDRGGPFLGDTLQMGRAFLTLYKATADVAWLKRAEAAASFISSHFKNTSGSPGLLTSELRTGRLPSPVAEVDENVASVRFLILLFHYSGKDEYQKLAQEEMRFLASPQVVKSRGFSVAGILLADDELRRPPLHVTVVGRKDDARAAELYAQALRHCAGYARLEWLDPSGPPLPNPDVEYPPLKNAAAFVCKDNTCSSPMTSVEALTKALSRGN